MRSLVQIIYIPYRQKYFWVKGENQFRANLRAREVILRSNHRNHVVPSTDGTIDQKRKALGQKTPNMNCFGPVDREADILIYERMETACVVIFDPKPRKFVFTPEQIC
jgi:hypothetical protein